MKEELQQEQSLCEIYTIIFTTLFFKISLGCSLFLDFKTGFFSGYRMRAGSESPVRRRNGDHRYSPNIDHSAGPRRSRGFGRGRDVGRYRDYSPSPYGRGRDMGRFGRGFDGPRFGPGPFRGDGVPRGHPNVRPREGDWMCPDPL